MQAIWRKALYILGTPVRLFRQRTIVHLMVSHVAVVLITFLLLNLLVAAVIVGWLPGSQLMGIQQSTQDPYLGDRARAMATWLDAGELLAADDGLDTPAGRETLQDRAETIVAGDVPGFREEPSDLLGNTTSYFGNPRAAIVVDLDGTVLASTDNSLVPAGDPAKTITDPGARQALEDVMSLRGTPDDVSGVSYSVRVRNEITSAAAPIFDDSGAVVGYIALVGYPLPDIFVQARTTIFRETGIAVLRASWIYLIPAILVAIPFAYLQSRSTSRRLERLAHLADAFADGDLHTRLKVTRRDEIGRLAERFNEMGTRIEEDARSRRTFLSNVAHELRTPVAIIQGTAEQLQSGTLRTMTEKDRAISLVHLEIQNLTRLIDDLSTLGRLEEAKLRLDLHPVDTHEIAEAAVQGLKQVAWKQRKVSIENIVPPDLPLAFCDAGRLRQVIHNLLFNALRHTPEGGLVVVQGAVAGNLLELSVSDTGIGIAPELLEEVFNRYYQAELAERNREGSGLGLHIVQQLVEAQGGTISVQSDVGKGTTFRFTVPISAQQGKT